MNSKAAFWLHRSARAELRAALLLSALVLIAGCARHQYHPAPLSPSTLAASLEARNLDDPDLRAWMHHSARFEPSSWPLQTWDLDALTLAAFYFSPDLDVARANAAAADSAIITAAAKPNPSVSIGPGYQTPNPTQFISTFDLSIPIETAGKRGYRIANTTQLSRASRLQLGQTAWVVRSRVRIALVDYLFAVQSAELLRNEESWRSSYVDLLERRLRAGEIALPDVTVARIDQTALRQTLRTSEGLVQNNPRHSGVGDRHSRFCSRRQNVELAGRRQANRSCGPSASEPAARGGSKSSRCTEGARTV